MNTLDNGLDIVDKQFETTPSAFSRDTPVGTTVTGTIVEAESRQVTDFNSGELEFWQNGDPKLQVVVTLQVAQPTVEDEGKRRVYVKLWGPNKQALREAIRACGAKTASEALAPGNVFTATYVSLSPVEKKPSLTQKIYEYQIERRAAGVDAAMGDTPVQQAQPVQQAPQPVQQAAPQPVQQAAPQQAELSPGQKAQQLLAQGIPQEQVAQKTGLDASTIAILATAI